MTLSYANNAACARAARNTASRLVFNRKIIDLILKLDRVVDYIPPDDLGGADEARTHHRRACRFSGGTTPHIAAQRRSPFYAVAAVFFWRTR